jgi:plastocyanin
LAGGSLRAGRKIVDTRALYDEPHTVISDAGLFRSGGMDTDETFSFKFDKPGTYRIVCSLHPRMVAAIVVE